MTAGLASVTTERDTAVKKKAEEAALGLHQPQ